VNNLLIGAFRFPGFAARLRGFGGLLRGSFSVVLILALAVAPATSAAAQPGFGPLFQEFDLTLTLGSRSEALGPFFYSEVRQDQLGWGLPPFASCAYSSDSVWREFDLLYPIVTYDRFGDEYRFQILQLFSFSGGGLQSGHTKDRFTLFPIYFQQRSADSSENYTALFPIYGKLRNRLFRSEIDFALWPLYVKTKRSAGSSAVGADEFLSIGSRWARARRGDVTTYNFIAPIFHLRYGDGLRGWQVWPLIGHEQKEITVRTNSWGDAETVPGYEKSFVLWPVWLTETREIGSTNASHFRSLFPLYNSLRSPERDSTSYLWPFGLTLTDDRVRQYRETDVLWPVFVYARGEGKTTTRFWPLFGLSHNEVMDRNFFLGPLYKHTHVVSAPLDRARTQILFFLYSDKRERNTDTALEARRVDLWPLFTHSRERNGNTRLQILSIIEPILSTSKSVERNYSPIWSIWRSENNPLSGASSQSLLWNLYRHQKDSKGNAKTSFLFGLFQHQSTPAGSGFRLFYIPFKKAPRPDCPVTVDSPAQLEQAAPGAKP